MDNKEFIKPLFLQNQSVDEIHSKMMSFLPDSLDKSEGQFPFEFTRPTAIEKAEMVEFILLEAIKTIFPMWSEGKILEYHAACRGIVPKGAKQAVGIVKITALDKTVIPKGFKFLTAATYEKAGVVFSTNYEVETTDLPIEIPVTAELSGNVGNVAAFSITLMDTPMEGILTITNEAATSGGIEAETDDELRERIEHYDQEQGVSFVGSLSDYKRWASEVDGVGSVKPYEAEDNSGTITIVMVDSNNEPAGEELCKAVYDYIMRPDSPMERKAPVNANLIVKAPTVVSVEISASLKIIDGYSIAQIRENFLRYLNDYKDTAKASTGILYNKVAGILIQTEGVGQYYSLTMNDSEFDIGLDIGEMVVFDVSNVVEEPS